MATNTETPNYSYILLCLQARSEGKESWLAYRETKEELAEAEAQLANGELYFKEGYRRRTTGREMIGMENLIEREIPGDALYSRIIPSGHISTTEAYRGEYLIYRGSADRNTTRQRLLDRGIVFSDVYQQDGSVMISASYAAKSISQWATNEDDAIAGLLKQADILDIHSA